jgi:hypothetical protein
LKFHLFNAILTIGLPGALIKGKMSICNHKYKYQIAENQFIHPSPKGSKLIFFAPHGDGVNEENQWI